MEYTQNEREILSLIERTDFKNLSKNDLLTYASKLNQLRPEVAAEVIKQFPEIAKLVQNGVTELTDVFKEAIKSDDASLSSVYQILENDLGADSQSRGAFIGFADKVRADLAKSSENPNLSPDERKYIIDQQMEILRLVDQKDTEIRKHESETINIAKEKDTEKRKFNWNTIGLASTIVLAAVGLAVAGLGGDFKLKLPGKTP